MSQLCPPRPVPPSQDQVFQFCCRDCCEDFKRLRGVVSQCEHCRQEKLLHEKLRFSGVEKSFCSEGKQLEKGQEALYLTGRELAEKGGGVWNAVCWVRARILYVVHPWALGKR